MSGCITRRLGSHDAFDGTQTPYSTPSTKTCRDFHLSPAPQARKELVILTSTWMSLSFFVFEAHHLRHPRLFRGASHRTNKAEAPRV
jgi:hypothetical protein